MHRTSDPLSALLAHNLWATRLILDLCRSLPDEQFRRPFPIGPGDRGGLCAIVTHIIGAMRRWADRIAARPVRAPIEPWRPGYQPRPPYSIDELLALLADAHQDLTHVIDAVHAEGEPALARIVTLQFAQPAGAPPQPPHTFTTGACIASAAVHGHYHRAQCMNILRQLNVPGVSDKLPSLDVIDWQQSQEP
ncbi:MAG: DinB family protein [Phycisphaerales bacterium]